ncbi:MAG: GntR family transcriptional regulator [Eubacteriales bacterium]
MLQLDYRDARPIYEQVKDNYRRLMMTGVMEQGEKLPSVRSLASSLAINPNTIAKAYEQLEQEGYIYTVQGKGTFVAPLEQVSRDRKKELLEELDRLIGELECVGMTRASIATHIESPPMVNRTETEEESC